MHKTQLAQAILIGGRVCVFHVCPFEGPILYSIPEELTTARLQLAAHQFVGAMGQSGSNWRTFGSPAFAPRQLRRSSRHSVASATRRHGRPALSLWSYGSASPFSVGRELRLGKPSELNRSREGCRAVALQSDAKADTLPVPPELLLASHVEGLLT